MPAEEVMNDTVVIVTGSEPLDPSTVADLPSHAIVLAADGGLDHALAVGLTPAGLIGDLDSISPEGLAWATEHATIQRHPEGKDHTDTELAIKFATAMSPERLVLLAGGGDRLDHVIAAIGALGAPELTSIPLIECWWGQQHIRVLHGPGGCTLHPRPGSTLSLLALHGPCTGVAMTGTRWELHGADLPAAAGRGVSNVVEQSPVSLRVSLGVLTVFFEPDADHPLDDPHEETTT
jgi:thiamine pyrophosphokinase